MKKKNSVICPVCGEIIFIESYLVERGTITCTGCDLVIEVVGSFPVRLQQAELVGSN